MIESGKDNLFDPEFRQWFNKSQRMVSDDYVTDAEKHSHSCTLIALEAAGLLLKRGMNPEVLQINPKTEHTSFRPKKFTWQVKWFRHYVCFNDGIVYDPILDEPEELEKYLAETFDSPVTVKIDEYLTRLANSSQT